MKLRSCVLALALDFACCISPLPALQSSPKPTPSPAQEIPVIDGNAGPCSVDLTVTDGQGKGVYSANVKVHMAYGFGGIRKLDLEAGTNSDGKVRFKGLPAKVHNPPLEFRATKDDLTGLATVNPATECQAKHDIVMEKLAKTAVAQ
jgi:hypothetical protein